MFPFPNSVQKHVKGKTIPQLANDPQLSPYLANLAPLSNSTKKKNLTRRTKRRTLGEGSFGRVNLETMFDGIGQVATKYTKVIDDLEGNIGELAALHYLSGYPNVAQIVGVSSVNADDQNISFPAILMAKAKSSLTSSGVNRSWPVLRQTILDILHGYYVLHSLGIAHRDTKPDNMLRTAYGETWVTDFGKARYIAPHIPLVDGYTGTRWYCSPEILLQSILKETVDEELPEFSYNWFAQDCWGVGVSILEILTDISIFAENGRNLIMKKIFTLRGTPTVDDNKTYDLFILYQQYYGSIRHIRKAKPTMISIMLDSAMHVEIHDDERDALSTMLNGLFTYDPEKRMTIAQALECMGEKPIAIPRPLCYANTSIPNSELLVRTSQIIQTFYRITSLPDRNDFTISEKSKYIVLDRTFSYLFLFIQKYSDFSLNQLVPVAMTSLILASCLFNASGAGYHLDVGLKYYVTEKQIMKYLPMFDIPFYGTTILDTMIGFSSPSDLVIKQYGLLNLLCFQQGFYFFYHDRIDELIAVCVGIVTNPLSVLTKLADYDSPTLFLNVGVLTDIGKEIESGMGTRRANLLQTLRQTESDPISEANRHNRNFVNWKEKTERIR